jgi:hypothetical protein
MLQSKSCSGWIREPSVEFADPAVHSTENHRCWRGDPLRTAIYEPQVPSWILYSWVGNSSIFAASTDNVGYLKNRFGDHVNSTGGKTWFDRGDHGQSQRNAR